MRKLEKSEMVMMQGGLRWRCTNASNWFSVTGYALTALVATGPVGIIAGVWGTFAATTGTKIGAGDLIAGC